jgi:CCR4-NOT transcription complex subunit 6
MILAEPSQNSNTSIFTTMCYNVLCDKYATRQYYGYCPAWALTWDYRKKLILDDIKNFNADVIALQELETEQFYQFFLPELRQYDYDGIFSPKSRAKTMSEQDKKHVDGCAIMFKTSRFQLVKDYLVEFNQIAMATAEGSEDMLNRVMTKDNIGLAALLEVKQEDSSSNSDLTTTNTNNSKSPNIKEQNSSSSSSSSSTSSSSSSSSSLSGSPTNKQMLLVCTAHIHWDPDYCDVKLIQTLMFTNEIKLIIEQAQREFRPNQLSLSNGQQQQVDCSSSIPVVICADLNSLPESGVIEYLRTGRILANHVDFKDLGYDSCLQKINTSDKPSELSHNLKLECAYNKEIMPYTNYTLVLLFF